MSGCCGGTDRVLVEVERLVIDGETCERCGDTWHAAEEAVALVADEVARAGAAVELVERPLDPTRIEESNRVLVAGRPVEDWLGGSASFTDCPSCGDLVGEPTCCRAYEIDGEAREALTAEDIARAVRLAAGVPARPRIPSAVVSARPTLVVTYVTSDACG